MSWDLDGIVVNWDLIKKYNFEFIDSLFDYYELTESYQRALALNLSSFEFTTTEEIYNKTGLYSLQIRRTDNKVTLIGSTDLLFHFTYISTGMNIISLGQIPLLNKNNKTWSYLNLNFLVNNIIIFDSDVFNEAWELYPNFISTDYNFDDITAIKKLIKYMLKSKLKLDSLYLVSNSAVDYHTKELYVYMYTLKKCFDSIYFVITTANISRFFNKSTDSIQFVYDEMRKFNIKFKVFDNFDEFCSLIDYGEESV